MICFYHRSDLDGYCSGAIVHRMYPDIELVGIEYGDDFPWEKVNDQDVIMVDFSLQPFSEMDRLLAKCKTLQWIDHHKSAIESYQQFQFSIETDGKLFTVLDTFHAACELVWFNLFPHEAIPKAVRFLGRYDIWKWQETEGAIEFHYGMKRQHFPSPDSDVWTDLFSNQGGIVEAIIAEGKEIYAEMKASNAELIEKLGFEFENSIDGFGKLRFLACNRGPTNSQLFDHRFDPNKHDIMLPFYFNGTKWIISMYSTKDEIDCSAICKFLGGGGHKGAAGFSSDILPGWIRPNKKYEVLI